MFFCVAPRLDMPQASNTRVESVIQLEFVLISREYSNH